MRNLKRIKIHQQFRSTENGTSYKRMVNGKAEVTAVELFKKGSRKLQSMMTRKWNEYLSKHPVDDWKKTCISIYKMEIKTIARTIEGCQ